MRKYLIDDSAVETIEGIECQIMLYIEHSELNDCGSLEEELTMIKELKNPSFLDGKTETPGMMVGVNIYRVAIFPDGTEKEIQRIDTEITAMYALYKHLEDIDKNNTDGLPW